MTRRGFISSIMAAGVACITPLRAFGNKPARQITVVRDVRVEPGRAIKGIRMSRENSADWWTLQITYDSAWKCSEQQWHNVPVAEWNSAHSTLFGAEQIELHI